ncbi:hypothetical protein BSG1_16995 [Bacillus sp. SG-1]|nr:hypothetical protein BSG1_16995 [Bacillus sp. SG-1]
MISKNIYHSHEISWYARKKRATSLFREKKPFNQGENPALGIFPKATTLRKQPSIKQVSAYLTKSRSG